MEVPIEKYSTIMEENIGTLTKEERNFDDFHYLPKETLKQMIYHFNALIQGSLSQERNWVWDHILLKIVLAFHGRNASNFITAFITIFQDFL